MGPGRMPSLIGMPYGPVKQKMESLGHPVELVRGDAATDIQQQFHVERQQPAPDTPLAPNAKITLILYTKVATPARAAAANDRQAAGPVSRDITRDL